MGRGLVVAFNLLIALAVLVAAILIFGKARSPSRLRRRAIVPLSIVLIAMIADFVLYLLLEPPFPGTGETLRLIDLATSLGVPIAIVVGQHQASSYAERSAGRLAAGSQGDRVAPTGIEELFATRSEIRHCRSHSGRATMPAMWTSAERRWNSPRPGRAGR